MSIVNQITLKNDSPKVLKNLKPINGLSLRHMLMLFRYMNSFNSFYLEPSDDELNKYLPLFMNGKDEVSRLEIRRAIKRNVFCKMCLQISISPRIPLVKVIEFYNTNEEK